MNTADAFRVIGRSILRHIAGNETAVRRSDSEGVHQMRVGLRRLRAAISLFAKLLGDQETERVKSELKWLTGELAPARDLDVYMRNEIEPLRRDAPTRRGMKELTGALTLRRAAAFGKAKAAVESPTLSFASTRHAAMAGNWRLGQASAVLWTSTHRTFRRGYFRAAY